MTEIHTQKKYGDNVKIQRFLNEFPQGPMVKIDLKGL